MEDEMKDGNNVLV